MTRHRRPDGVQILHLTQSLKGVACKALAAPSKGIELSLEGFRKGFRCMSGGREISIGNGVSPLPTGEK
jgi:hypothetical protein